MYIPQGSFGGPSQTPPCFTYTTTGIVGLRSGRINIQNLFSEVKPLIINTER